MKIMTDKTKDNHVSGPPSCESAAFEEGKDRESLSSKVKTFCKETTAHGFSKPVEEDVAKVYKIAWCLIILCIVIGVITHLAFVILTYLKFKSQETVLYARKPPKFPHVTICNAAAWSQSHTEELSQNPDSQYTRYLNLLRSVGGELTYQGIINEIGMNDIMLSTNGVFANVDLSTVADLSHHLTDMILSCRYLGDSCDMRHDWITFITEDFYTCYTFTGGTKSGNAAPGPEQGLSLVLYLENDVPDARTQSMTYNIYSNLQNAFGARIEIHEPNTLPIPLQNGIDIMPGHSTSVGLLETRFEKLPPPWGDCTVRKTLPELESYTYSFEACMTVCLSKYIYDNCGCYHYLTPLPDFIGDNVYQYCRYFDNSTVSIQQYIDTYNCVKNMRFEFYADDDRRQKCDCEEACLYSEYSLTISENMWPAYLYQFDAFRQFTLEGPNSGSTLASQQLNDAYEAALNDHRRENDDIFADLMYNNFARVNIYYESTKVLQRKQVQSMAITDMFANIGGTLGLWVGSSVVTIVEVGFLVGNICMLCAKRCKKQNQNRIDTQENVKKTMNEQKPQYSL